MRRPWRGVKARAPISSRAAAVVRADGAPISGPRRRVADSRSPAVPRGAIDPLRLGVMLCLLGRLFAASRIVVPMALTRRAVVLTAAYRSIDFPALIGGDDAVIGSQPLDDTAAGSAAVAADDVLDQVLALGHVGLPALRHFAGHGARAPVRVGVAADVLVRIVEVVAQVGQVVLIYDPVAGGLVGVVGEIAVAEVHGIDVLCGACDAILRGGAHVALLLLPLTPRGVVAGIPAFCWRPIRQPISKLYTISPVMQVFFTRPDERLY